MHCLLEYYWSKSKVVLTLTVTVSFQTQWSRQTSHWTSWLLVNLNPRLHDALTTVLYTTSFVLSMPLFGSVSDGQYITGNTYIKFVEKLILLIVYIKQHAIPNHSKPHKRGLCSYYKTLIGNRLDLSIPLTHLQTFQRMKYIIHRLLG